MSVETNNGKSPNMRGVSESKVTQDISQVEAKSPLVTELKS